MTDNKAKVQSLDEMPAGSGFVMISPEFKQVLKEFLETRPFEETDHILETAFAPEHMDKMWTDTGFVEFIQLLRKMPRNVVKPILDLIAKPPKETDIQFYMKNAEPELKEVGGEAK